MAGRFLFWLRAGSWSRSRHVSQQRLPLPGHAAHLFFLAAIRGWGGPGKHLAPKREEACWSRFGGGTVTASVRPRRERKLAGCDSGVGRARQVSGPEGSGSFLVAIRGWDGPGKHLAPNGAKKVSCRALLGKAGMIGQARPWKTGKGMTLDIMVIEKLMPVKYDNYCEMHRHNFDRIADRITDRRVSRK